jgi:glycosyltransferase involved in cell wall biosynthesis
MKEIKIAIVAHSCRAGGGLIGTLDLLRALKKVSQKERFLLVCSTGYGYENIELPANTEYFVYTGGHSLLERYWFEHIKLPKIVERYGPDVIFAAGNIGLTKPSVPQAIFIRQAYLFYDISYYPDIDWRLRLRMAALKSKVKKSLRRTNLVFCQTPVVKKRFSEEFSYPENQIDILRFPAPAEVKPKAGVKKPAVMDESVNDLYILVLTRYMPHRNPGVLIPFCIRYHRELCSKGIKFITTVGDSVYRQADVFLKDISKHKLGDIIVNVGDLSREDVQIYFTYSDVLWMPTTLETLCLPYLEAMAMGVPILAPDLDFARYVCGEAAVFYDPWDIESLFNKIMLISEDTCLRKQLRQNGKVQLGDRKKFSEDWDEVAFDVLTALRGLAEGN